MTKRTQTGPAAWLDRAAIALSGLCLVHCLGSAILVAAIASGGGALLGHGVHEVGLALALALGAAALGTGLGRHGDVAPVLVGGAGLLSMALALVLPHGLGEMLCTMAGVSILAFGHHLNRRAAASATG